ncbi:uncharacterized protein A1O5_01036 [Cladophialophora psammophila CBS 110553]|uniref:CID domain-containing protein n=1 Tax=Cladophialophora psammophila CBS 110553 TaxID=1182543 RepID=W9X8I4_9EURO|nr:uncharacterized protein A1O5_01036 [Cladophialophora psammophila CBS 110553]EXJ76528.1 hypothetical protein A1O5_01036 [Cladophialophora psammophila CBS 110553]
MLYLLNDLLHHAKYHGADVALRNNLSQSLEPFLADLFQFGASGAKTRVRRRLSDLVQLWKEEEYFGRHVINQLHDVLAGTTTETKPTLEPEAQRKQRDTELPYLIPSTHGDPSLPFYDLPAGNLMRHIVPNSSQPIQPDEVRALQFSAGPADESLVNALKDFLNDVKGIKDTLPNLEESGLSPEIDEMGQISYHDEAGDLVGDTYYGWSRNVLGGVLMTPLDGRDQEARIAVEVRHLTSADVAAIRPMDVPDPQGRIAGHLADAPQID